MLSPQQQKQQTLDALTAWLGEEADRQPVLTVWEDVHWADPSTLEMLGLWIEQAPTMPVLHVLTFRPEFTPSWPMRSHMTPITLNRLERPQVEALIAQLLDGHVLPPEVTEHIVAKTDGVPLYVEELTKMLLDSDLLRLDTDQYVLTGPLSSVAIPETLQDSLMARLDQMKTAKDIAQLGSVLGRDFGYEMLRAIASQDEATLQAGLAQLVEAELLYQRGRPPRAHYIFKHALIQEAAYTSLLRSTRQQVHQRIAQTLETQFADVVEAQPELLAHHHIEAGQNETAIGYLQRAGQWAGQHSAYEEAIAHLKQGLALLKTLPDSTKHRQQELALQIALGPALMAINGYATPDVERTYVRARDLCEQLGDTQQLVQVLRGLMLHYINRGDMQTAYPIGEAFLRLAQTEGDPTALLIAHYMLGVVVFLRGKPADAQSHYRQALAIYTSPGHQALASGHGIEVGMGLRSYVAWGLWQLGYPDQALEHSRETLRLAQESMHPHTMAQAPILAAFLHQHRREPSATLKQVEAAMPLVTEQAFTQWHARGMAPYGWALTMQEQGEQGIDAIHQGLDAELESRARVWKPYFLGLLAEAYGKGGHPEAGLEALTEALAAIDATLVRFYESEIYRLKGQLLLQQSPDNTSEAEFCFHQAISIAQNQSAKSWELRAATSLAQLWQSQDKHQDAYDLLSPVYDWFTEGFETVDLIDAKALLKELDG